MTVPDELHYTPEHEWVTINDSVATVGITDHAQNALGDVVYVSLPQPGGKVSAGDPCGGVFCVPLPRPGGKVSAGDPCGEVESTKSVSDIYSPVDGEVTEVNAEIDDDPGLVNSDPYGAGWLFKGRLA